MKSIRDIYKIGKGPSSSHTIGPERAAKLFKSEHPEADSFRVVLYGSLSKTGRGHGTDRVLQEVLSPLPTEIIFSEEMPHGVHHPNTMDFFAQKDGQDVDTMRVQSIGGGDIHIEGRDDLELPEIYPENSFAEVEQFCRFRGLDLAEYVEINEGEDIWEFLDEIWRTMKRSVEEGLMTEGMLPGGLKVERKAKMLFEHPAPNEVPQVRECRIVSAYAFAVSEQNADCGTIVTAPTSATSSSATPPSPAPSAAARPRSAPPAPWLPPPSPTSSASRPIRSSTPPRSPWSTTWGSPATPSADWCRFPASSATPWPPCAP